MSIDRENTLKNSILLVLLLVYYCLSTIMPVVAYSISAYIYMLTVVMLYAYFILANRNSLASFLSFMLPMLFFLVLQLLNSYLNTSKGIPLYIYDRLLYYMPLVIMYFFLYNNKRNLVKIIVIVALSAYVITAITTIIGLLQYPNAARIIATLDSPDSPYAVLWGKRNIGGFTFIYSLVLIFPMIICLVTQKKINVLVFLIIAAVMGLCIVNAQYATAILTFFISVPLIFTGKEFRTRHFIILIISAILIYFAFRPLIAELMLYLSKNVSSYTLSQRFLFINNYLNGVDSASDVNNRIMLYKKSIECFTDYPITGVWVLNSYLSTYRTGGHSFILDTLGQYGIIGGIAIFAVFRQIYIKFYLPFKDTKYYGFLVWCFLLFILLSIINPSNLTFSLCLVIPGAAYLMQDKAYRIGKNGLAYFEEVKYQEAEER